MNKSLIFLIILLLASRLVPLIDPTMSNLTPIIAIAGFLPFVVKKTLSYAIILGIMIFTDLLIGFSTINFVVYGVLALIIAVAPMIKNWFLTAIISVGIWHLVVNFFVFLTGTHNLSLVDTYLLGIPYDFRLLTATLFYSYLFGLLLLPNSKIVIHKT